MSAFKTWLNGLTSKTTPVDADEMYLRNSVGAASNKVTWANLKATLLAYFDTAYLKLTGGTLSGSVSVPSTQGYKFNTYTNPVLMQVAGNTGVIDVSNGVVTYWDGLVGPGYGRVSLKDSGVTIRSNASFSWADNTTGSDTGAIDLLLYRDAANTLAQRNGTNAQTSRLYGTYTDASNYRRVALAMTTTGVATLAPEGAGTGASGNVLHISGLPTSNPGAGILWNDSGTVKVGT